MDEAGIRRHMLRIVVQRVAEDIEHPYHLVAYGNGRAYRPRGFRSLKDLSQTLVAALHDFDVAQLSSKGDTGGSSVVFTGDMTLSDSQLTILGLKREPE